MYLTICAEWVEYRFSNGLIKSICFRSLWLWPSTFWPYIYITSQSCPALCLQQIFTYFTYFRFGVNQRHWQADGRTKRPNKNVKLNQIDELTTRLNGWTCDTSW